MLVGDRDPCRRLYVEPLHSLRPDFPVVIILGAGHVNCIAKEQFQTELLGWIEKQGQ
jgi:hypothetical protein